ncbi:ADP-dependent NAD(P)H-hydrate dehydratase, partial [Enterococcus asini]
MELITKDLVKKVIKPRPEKAYKGNFGKVTLIGGDAHYGGAILMATESCVLAGAGLTTVVTAAVNHTPLHSRRPEAMVVDWQDFAQVEQAIESADVLLVGPGLGDSETARKLLHFLLKIRRKEQWLIL